MSASDDPQQCRALTKEGTRCSRDAVDGQFCHQHDEDDPTINDEDASDQEMNEQVEDTADEDESDTGTQDASSLSSAANGTTEESGDDEEESEAEASGDDPDTSETDAAESDGTGADASGSSAGGVMEVRDTVKSVASELVGFPLDGVIEITRREDGWTAVIEVIERRSVPDTQDILGQYEITLEDADTIAGYRRTGRHRRSDTGDEIRE